MGPLEQLEVIGTIKKVDKLINSGIFTSEHSQNVLQDAAFTELMINLRDLMYKVEKHSNRIAFTDDVPISDKIKDVTDLIIRTRNACCHIDSEDKDFKDGPWPIIGSFSKCFGNASGTWTLGIPIGGKYDDDVQFAFGMVGIYLNRHIIRAFNEAKTKLEPLISRQ